MSKPIVFLDIDGVLNSFESQTWGTAPRALLLPECVDRFNRIIEQTEAEIVLSSSWRHYILGGSMTLRGFEHLLRSHGVRGSLIATTCDDDEADDRGEQIRLWRRQNAPGCRYVVLDDLDDGISARGLSFVLTNGSVGLTDANAAAAIAALQAGQFECEHQWGTDGAHSNEYCKKCFIDRPNRTVDEMLAHINSPEAARLEAEIERE